LQRIKVVERTRQFNGRFTWFDSDDLDLVVA
jgi:hypothetical protein